MNVDGMVNVRFLQNPDGEGLVAVVEFSHADGHILQQSEPIPISAGNKLSYGPLKVDYNLLASENYGPDSQGMSETSEKSTARTEQAKAEKPAAAQMGSVGQSPAKRR